MPGAVVSNRPSTTMSPFSLTATPASASPSPSVLPARPIANSTFSGLKLCPVVAVTSSSPSTRRTLASGAPSTSRMPMPLKISACIWQISGSRCRSRCGLGLIKVTSTPSAAKMDAYSHPTAPPPPPGGGRECDRA